jgi:ferrous iron transport protein B
MSTVAAIRRETRSWRWPAFVLVYTYAAGFAAATVVYQVGRQLGFG